MLRDGFPRHVSRLLSCTELDIPVSAANFLLYSSVQSVPSNGGHQSIDILIENALDRFSVEVKNVSSHQATRLGRLYTKPGGFILKIRRDVRNSTYRFVKAHELSHVLAYDINGTEPRRCFVNSVTEEKFCDRIARCLLLPDDLLSDRLDRIEFSSPGFSLQEILSVAERYDVTPWLIVRRLIERNVSKAESTVAILWRQESKDVLRVKDTVAPTGVFVPLNDRSFRNGQRNQAAWKAIDSWEALSNDDEVLLGSLRGYLKSISFAYTIPHPSVIQVLTLDDHHIAKSSKWRAHHKIVARSFSATS